ncbi:MAG: hypothetical protein ACFB21_06780 [Opitutales bacterium]
MTTAIADLPSLPDRVPERLRLLTPESYQRWLDDGYIVIPQAIPNGLADAVAAEILDFAGIDPHDQSTWYSANTMGMVEMYASHHEWLARTSPRVHDAFADLWGCASIEAPPTAPIATSRSATRFSATTCCTGIWTWRTRNLIPPSR